MCLMVAVEEFVPHVNLIMLGVFWLTWPFASSVTYDVT